ncbi:VOC family protein [Niveispirillum sp.]|uniref:VOC family protein n=1 Tax=Niveispirillum sp. TaxID=1917217 RepID=UPI001B5A3721|nr:VOC family protein [Niveispirillum sp.]MBP7334990.1 VOC family protein [Niveispirillum sp.]
MRIAHVALWTTDLDEAARFWVTHFGAEVGDLYESRRRPGFTSRFVRLKEGAVIELMSAPWLSGEGEQGWERCGWAHIALSLGSQAAVNDLAARLSALDLLDSGPRWTGDGYYEAVVKDPDGNLIEITV